MKMFNQVGISSHVIVLNLKECFNLYGWSFGFGKLLIYRYFNYKKNDKVLSHNLITLITYYLDVWF